MNLIQKVLRPIADTNKILHYEYKVVQIASMKCESEGDERKQTLDTKNYLIVSVSTRLP
jgi:hypothetical protein